MAVQGLDAWYSGWREGGIEGLEMGFGNRLWNMFLSMPEEIASQVSIISGYRSIEAQQELWDKKVAEVGEQEARKWVAPPGKSNHQQGTAADLKFLTDSARRWVHENAGKYGLAFHLNHEDWHIEPAGLRDGNYVLSGQRFDPDFAEPVGVGFGFPDPEAYTDGQGLPENNDGSLETQLLRVADLVSGSQSGAMNRMRTLDPKALANRNIGVEVPDAGSI